MRSKAKNKELLLAAQQENTQKHYPGSKLISVAESLFLYRQHYYHHYHHHLDLRHFKTIQEEAL